MTPVPSSATAAAPSALGPDARRAIIYLFYDRDGIVDDYIPYKLTRLRAHADHILVVVNGQLDAAQAAKLNAVADTVLQRENTGMDVGGYRAALDELGERISEFDELLLMNYTFFGPVGSFDDVFSRMNERAVDFWGMTVHGEENPNPITGEGIMRAHLQSHWIAVRSRVLRSDDWRDYWASMPEITSYRGSILNHESRFTGHFADLGYTWEAAFPPENYPGTSHAAFESALQLLRDGCPVLKRRPFFHDPLYLDRHAIIGRWLIDEAAERGYPVDLIWPNVVRAAAPKVLNTNASMLEVLPHVDVSYDAAHPLRLVAVVHVYYVDLTEELLDRLDLLPQSYDLVITTTDDDKAAEIRRVLAARATTKTARTEVRVLPSNRGRDLSAFFVACHDIITSDDYDLVIKIHSKKTVQQGAAAGEFFKRQQLENLLASEGYAANILGLFQREPGLGVVFAPTVHVGYPTLGGAWFGNKEPARALLDAAGVHVPLDDRSPLAPMGAMWIARPAAMARIATELDYDDYLPESEHRDGSLAHVQERVIAYGAAQDGFHTRTVANPEYIAISHTFLEYKYDQIMAPIQGYAIDARHDVHDLVGAGRLLATPRFRPVVSYYIRRHHPRLAQALLAPYTGARGIVRRLRALVRRPQTGSTTP
jgi:rhamnosyltransferase